MIFQRRAWGRGRGRGVGKMSVNQGRDDGAVDWLDAEEVARRGQSLVYFKGRSTIGSCWRVGR